MLTMTIALVLSQATAAAAAAAEPDAMKGPIVMNASQIKAYNAKLSRDDPAYIRCERTAVTGSLTKKHTTCRTIAEWRAVNARGNQAGRDFVATMSMGGTRDGAAGGASTGSPIGP